MTKNGFTGHGSDIPTLYSLERALNSSRSRFGTLMDLTTYNFILREGLAEKFQWAHITYTDEERQKGSIQGKVELTNLGREVLESLAHISRSMDSEVLKSIEYGSQTHHELVRDITEEEHRDFSPFFNSLLNRLNSLSNGGATLVSKIASFEGEYDINNAADGKRQQSDTPRKQIRYVREFRKETVSSDIPFYEQTILSSDGYTGFVVSSPLEIWAVNPQMIGEMIIKQKRMGALKSSYKPTVYEFFKDCLAYENIQTIEFEKVNKMIVEELIAKFPEANDILKKLELEGIFRELFVPPEDTKKE